MKRITRNVFVVLLLLLVAFFFASCQSAEELENSVEITTGSGEESQPMLPPPPAEVESVEEVKEIPVSVSAQYLGYRMDINSYDGYAEITYPVGIVTDGDIDAFIAVEAAKYGITDPSFTYSIGDGIVTVAYPEGIGENTRRSYASMLITDVIETVNRIYPQYAGSKLTLTFKYGGYELKAVYSGKAIDVSYPDVLTNSQLSGFIGALNLEYGDTLGGVFYEIAVPGIARCTFVKNAGVAEAGAFVSILTTALVTYML